MPPRDKIYGSTSKEMESWINDYSDEELVAHIGLQFPFTETELAERMRTIRNTISTSKRPNVERILELYDLMEDRLEELVAESEDEEEPDSVPAGVPSMPSKINKSHTIIINSDKRADRTQSPSSFSWQLKEEIANVKKLYIESYTIPKTWYDISSKIGNNIFGISFHQPIKLYFTDPTGGDPGDRFVAKSPDINFNEGKDSGFSSVFDASLSKWFNQTIATNDIGAGLIRQSSGELYTSFPSRWTDVSWTVNAVTDDTAFATLDDFRTNVIAYSVVNNNIEQLKSLVTIDGVYDPSNVRGFENYSDLSGTIESPITDISNDFQTRNIFDVKKLENAVITSYTTIQRSDIHGKDISSADTIPDISNNDGSIITISNDTHTFKRYIRVGDAIFDNWETISRIETAITDVSFTAGDAIKLDANATVGTTPLEPFIKWGDLSFVNVFSDFSFNINYQPVTDISLDISYLNMAEGATYEYFVVRDTNGGTDPLTSTNVSQNGEKNLYYLIRKTVALTDVDVADFVTRRRPIDFSGINTDPRAEADFGEVNAFDYNNVLAHFENINNQFIPSNTKTKDDYDIWSSFKKVDYGGKDRLVITTNVLQNETADIIRDISDISWSIVSDPVIGKSINVNTTPGSQTVYQSISAEYINSSTIQLTLTAKPDAVDVKKRMKREIYFQLKDGFYGTVSNLLNANDSNPTRKGLNIITPKRFYDSHLANPRANIVEELLEYVIDAPVDLSNEVLKSHEYIRNAYKNEYGTSFFNTIDWKFVKGNDKISVSSLSADVSFIFVDSRMEELFKGSLTCGSVRENKRDAIFTTKNTLGRILGFFSDPKEPTRTLKIIDGSQLTFPDGILDTAGLGARNKPDLRRVRNIKIMLVDYKNYAYSANSEQSDPGSIDNAIKTPWYYNEVVFDASCQEAGTQFQQPKFTRGNSRQLTENQIYSLNEIFTSQENAKSNEKVLNYAYRDYFLYGIGINDQPEPGNSANDRVLAKFESKKGVRTYNEPTRLTKFHVEFVDQDFNLIDFNGIDVELVLNIDTEISTTR
jgi:hypothetical protein